MARLAVGPVLIDAWSATPTWSIICIALTLCSSIKEPSVAKVAHTSAIRVALADLYSLPDDDDDDNDDDMVLFSLPVLIYYLLIRLSWSVNFCGV